MKYLFKPGDRVVHRKTKRAGSVHAVRDAGMFGEGYRVAWDMGADEKLVPESDLLPESPTYKQCEQELCRVMQLMIDNRKQHLALLEEATVWAKKMRDLKAGVLEPVKGEGHTLECKGNAAEWSGSPSRYDTGWECDECGGFIPCDPINKVVP